LAYQNPIFFIVIFYRRVAEFFLSEFIEFNLFFLHVYARSTRLKRKSLRFALPPPDIHLCIGYAFRIGGYDDAVTRNERRVLYLCDLREK
jgi:hypothetical protein